MGRTTLMEDILFEEATQPDSTQPSTAQPSSSASTSDATNVTAPSLPPESVVLEAPAVSVPAPVGESIISLLREILETIIFALLVFLLVQAVSRNYKVQSISMQPNLYEGQYLVVNRLVYARGGAIDLLRKTVGKTEPGRKVLDAIFHSPQRGEVLVFVPVTNTKPDLIKRVIGIEGDKVELKQGQVYINDKPIGEPYIRPAPTQSFGPVVVGKDQLFVMGDNRGNSSDSRVFGMLPMKNVIGKAWLRYWPPNSWGFIRHYDLAQQLH
jgi:signal peptidase I